MTAKHDYAIGHDEHVIAQRVHAYEARECAHMRDENLVRTFMADPAMRVPCSVREAYARIEARAIGAEGKR